MTTEETTTRKTSNRCPIEPRPRDVGRYVAVPVGEDVAIADTDADGAWIRSDSAIELESME